MNAPDQISAEAFDQALVFLGFEDPSTVVEARFDGGTLAVVRVVRDNEGTILTRGNNPVYEQSTYVLDDES